MTINYLHAVIRNGSGIISLHFQHRETDITATLNITAEPTTIPPIPLPNTKARYQYHRYRPLLLSATAATFCRRHKPPYRVSSVARQIVVPGRSHWWPESRAARHPRPLDRSIAVSRSPPRVGHARRAQPVSQLWPPEALTARPTSRSPSALVPAVPPSPSGTSPAATLLTPPHLLLMHSGPTGPPQRSPVAASPPLRVFAAPSAPSSSPRAHSQPLVTSQCSVTCDSQCCNKP
ncbi:mucin-7-like [Penaeus vannamei]|uniref:mucin-7-like n=1 Tax=Penaeus vannamei TaxID=6689 RepID=UPI00387F5957